MREDRLPEDEIEALGKDLVSLSSRLALVLRSRFSLSGDIAEEVVGDVFFRIIESARSTNEDHLSMARRVLRARREGFLHRYLSTVVANRFLDFVRREQRQSRVLRELIERIGKDSTVPPNEMELEFERLRAAVARLDAPYRQIFEVKLNEGLSLAEIARRERIPLGSIYKQYGRGLAQLRALLGESGLPLGG